MNVALRKAMSREEFLAWQEQQELRYEYDGFAAVAMTGETLNHAAIQASLIAAVHTRLRGKPCRAARTASPSFSSTPRSRRSSATSSSSSRSSVRRYAHGRTIGPAASTPRV